MVSGQGMGKIHMRKSIRLKGYDYSLPGAYFLTIVTRGRKSVLGKVIDNEMHLSDFGAIVRHEWFRTSELRSEVRLERDDFVAMPNHVHGIILIDVGVGAQRRCAPTVPSSRPHVVPGSLGAIVRAFKASTTRHINQLRRTPHMPVWQRNYYEHVIRGEDQLERIRRYIVDNPLQWKRDLENPNASRLTSAPSIDEPWRA